MNIISITIEFITSECEIKFVKHIYDFVSEYKTKSIISNIDFKLFYIR